MEDFSLFLNEFYGFLANLNEVEHPDPQKSKKPTKTNGKLVFLEIRLSNEREARFPCIYMYNICEYARSYLYKPVPESGLGLASPPRLGASPLATQMNLNKFKRSCLYRLVPGSGLGLASPPRFGGLRMN